MSLPLARHVPGERKNGRVIAAGLIEAGDEMGAAGSRRTGADRKPASKLGLAGGGERRSFLMADTNPFNIGAADRIGERIERVANQCENMLDPNLLKHANHDVRDRLGHRCLLKNRGLSSRTEFISDVSNGNPSTAGSSQWLHAARTSAAAIRALRAVRRGVYPSRNKPLSLRCSVMTTATTVPDAKVRTPMTSHRGSKKAS
jgi:hypothetical protein